MLSATVIFFNPVKVFGFVELGTGDTGVFVHISGVERSRMRTLVEGLLR